MTPVSGEWDVCVGLDIGTTSVKAVAVDGDGTVVARARVAHRVHVPAPDRFEHDARQAWQRGPARALAQVSSALAHEPVAVAVSSMVPSLTAVDGRGRPVGPGLLYGDGRGRGDGQDRRGSDAGEAVEFLRWLAGAVPGAAGFWPAPAVANHALGGAGIVDSATAFSMHPLFGLEGWDAAVVEDAGASPDQLPAVAANGQPIGHVGGDRVTVLAAGAIDAMGEQLVAGADDVGDVLVICGTTLIVWVVVDSQVEVDGLWTIPSFVPGRFLVGGPSNAGGLFLDWARRLVGRTPHPARDPGRVPVFSPYVRGERVPLHDPSRRAALDGLDLTHDAAAVRRAAHEASAFAARHILDLARTGGAEPRRVVATGGGTRDAAWMQALADGTGLPVDVVATAEGGALGAAWFARMGAGLETSMTDAARWARTARRVAADADWSAAMAPRYARYRELAEGRTGR